MLLLSDLSQAISAYRKGSVSVGEFEDWFRTASRGMFGDSKEVLDVCLAIEAAFSELEHGEMSNSEFGVELANTIRLFDIGRRPPKITFGIDSLQQSARPLLGGLREERIWEFA